MRCKTLSEVASVAGSFKTRILKLRQALNQRRGLSFALAIAFLRLPLTIAGSPFRAPQPLAPSEAPAPPPLSARAFVWQSMVGASTPMAAGLPRRRARDD